MSATTTITPDLDRLLSYRPDWGSDSDLLGRCRLRAWFDPGLVVVSEIGINEGPSITNGIESVARSVERVLDIDLLEDAGYRLLEHYPPIRQRPMTVVRVRFGRRARDGSLRDPMWTKVPSDLTWVMDELREDA